MACTDEHRPPRPSCGADQHHNELETRVTATTETTTKTTYAWMITLQKPIPGGMAMNTQYGTVHLAPGSTRHEVYGQLRAELDRQNPQMSDANVVFFSLEPNDL